METKEQATFQIGDRVRVKASINPDFVGSCGRIEKVYTPGLSWAVRLDESDHCFAFNTEELEGDTHPSKDELRARAEAAEAEIRQILAAMKSHSKDRFVIITDGAIDWERTVAEFVSFIEFDAKGLGIG